jgi:hypothetical protein
MTWHQAMAKVGSSKSTEEWLRAMGSLPAIRKDCTVNLGVHRVNRFTVEHISGLEWQQVVPMQTPQHLYRVEITWALDRYRITVIDLASCHVLRCVTAWYARTAVDRANKYLRHFTKLEPKEAL